MERVLVVDDEEGIRSFIAEVLTGEGLQVTLAEDGQEALDLLARKSFHLLISDLKMPRVDGMELLRRARAEQPEMEVIMLTAYGTVQSAVEAMRIGAFDYLQKPLSGPDELRLVTARALERRRLLEDNRRVALGGEIEMVATDPAMSEVNKQLAKVAPTDATVLLEGESGTGKEVAARRLHALSRRKQGPFVAVNCAALSAELLESELFGHEKGAFTGAIARKRGRFELADGGTLFLDEVAELKMELQAKLLRVLEERSFERVGGTRVIDVDIRLVAATNRDLKTEIENGRFREDLYHRLAVFPIHLPPLRDRKADIIPLAEHLLVDIGLRLGKPGLSLDEQSIQALREYPWPGNVRELANVLERAAIMAEGRQITPSDLLLAPSQDKQPGVDGTLKELERRAIIQALEACGGHRKNAAKRLGIGVRTLYDKLKEYDIA